MNEKLGIFICNNLVPEVAEVLKTGNYPDVKLQSFPNSCIGSPIENNFITNLTSSSMAEFSKILFFVSSCRARGNANISPAKNIEIIHLEQCFEIILNKEIIYHFIRQGYYLVTSGWLNQYKHHITDWGFQDNSAKVFFGESLKKILFLDTGLSGDYHSKLEAISEYTGLPYEVFPVGLSHCRNYIDLEISRWRFENERNHTNLNISKFSRENADYSFLFKQLQTLVEKTDEQSIISEIFGLFLILFAPQNIAFQNYLGVAGHKFWQNEGLKEIL